MSKNQTLFPDRGIIQSIRHEYPAGCTVELLEMDDPYRVMPKGLKDTVFCVDDAGTIHVNWENGSTLGVAYGVDRVRRVYKNTRVYYLYRDGMNYKTQNTVVLRGQITQEQIYSILSCCEGENFIPEQIGWDLIRNWDITPEDHCYAELDNNSFEPTDDDATADMSVEDAVKAFAECKDHWDAVTYAPDYDPEDEEKAQ